jgi:O-acetyl-ADP-ribose deacetylase (regulator of RNase III)
MQFEYKIGDLLLSDEKAIAHGCNTKGAYGAGIAGQIAKRFPKAKDMYLSDLNNFKLGSVQTVWCLDRISRDDEGGPRTKWIFNLATQRNPGADASLWAIFLAFANLAEACYEGFSRIAIPRIGCGIGGLEWDQVGPTIKRAIECSSTPDLVIAVYDLP